MAPSSPVVIKPERYNIAGIYIVRVKPGVNISAFLNGLKISPMYVWDEFEHFAAELGPFQLETLYKQPEVQTIEPNVNIEFDPPRPDPPRNGIDLRGGPHSVHLNYGVDTDKFLEDMQITEAVICFESFVADLSPEKLLELTRSPEVSFIESEPSNPHRITLPQGLVLEFM